MEESFCREGPFPGCIGRHGGSYRKDPVKNGHCRSRFLSFVDKILFCGLHKHDVYRKVFCSLSFIGISSISNDQGHAIANDAIANFYGGFNDVSLVQEKEQADRVFLFLFYDQPDPRSTISIDRGNASFGKIYVCSLYWPGIFIGNVT